MADHKNSKRNRCCIKCKNTLKTTDDHLDCKLAVDNVDFVSCKICGLKKKKLFYHIKNDHQIDVSEYKKTFPDSLIICKSSSLAYGRTERVTTNYRNKLRAQGNLDELEKFNKSVSKVVSEIIMANPKERARRAKLLGNLNKTEKFRKKASDTAKITSARLEIQKERNDRLIAYRENNPNAHWQSKPEKDLYNFCSSLSIDFKRSQVIKRENWSNKSKRHQIDIFNKKNKTVIEYDGPVHFKPIYGKDNLTRAQTTDLEVNSLAKEGYLVVRIGYDQYKYRGKLGFTDESIKAMNYVLNSYSSGTFFIGDAYGENNFLRTYRNPSNLRSGSLP